MSPPGDSAPSIVPTADVTLESFDPNGVLRLGGLAEPPARAERVSEPHAGQGGLSHAGEQQFEVVFQQMLQQARRDGHPEIRLRMLAPAQRELPHRFWLR